MMKSILPIILLTAISLSAQKAQWAVKPRYEAISTFSEGVAAVKLNGKWGYVTDKGKEIVSPTYDAVYPFSEGVGVIASADNSLVAIVDKTGNQIVIKEKLKIDSRFATFNDGLLLVFNSKKWGYINPSGNLTIDCKYISAQPFSEGLAAVLLSEYWYYIGTNGSTMIRPNAKREIYWALGFHEGKAILLYKNGMGYIDTDGRELNEKLPQITPPPDASSYKEKTLICKEGELVFDTKSRAKAFVTVRGERTEFIPPEKKNEEVEIMKAANTKVGAVVLSNAPSIAFAPISDTIMSIFGNPATVEYVIHNTSPWELENLEINVNGKLVSTQPSIAPGKESLCKFLLDKTNEEPVEIRDVQLSVSEYGLLIGEDRRKITLKNITAIQIDIPDDNVVVQNEQASYPLDVRLENLSSTAVDQLVVSVGSQKQMINMGGGEAKKIQFKIPSSTQMINVVVKPPRSPQVSKSKRINVRKVEQNQKLLPDSVRLSKPIIIQ
jgi:hypothetical protein